MVKPTLPNCGLGFKFISLGHFKECPHPVHIVVGDVTEQGVHSRLESDGQSTCGAAIEL